MPGFVMLAPAAPQPSPSETQRELHHVDVTCIMYSLV